MKMLDYDSAVPPISQVQRLHLELLRTVQYNEFDGEAIVRDLLAHRGLWISAMGERLPPPIDDWLAKRKGQYIDLRRLLYMSGDRWAVDSMIVLTSRDHLDALKARITKHWQVDLLEVVDQEEAAWCMGLYPHEKKNDRVVLYLWWD